MPLGLYFGYEVDDLVERVIAVERVKITSDQPPERYQRYNLLSEFLFSQELKWDCV